jgi:murein DD-endopeptidase MepM/ murein hydrolase activator NlpD
VSGLSARERRAIGLTLLLSGCFALVPASASAEMRPARTAAAAKASPDDGKTRSPRAGATRCVHVVRRGDSVRRIAAQYRVSRQSIITANHLANAGALRVGQRLQIAGCKAAPASRVTERATAIISRDGATLVARVGPRRIATPLYLAVPEFHGGPIFEWPIDGPILSGFGRRPGGWHAGVDIRGEAGAPIRAAAAGVVVVSTWEATYGYIVKLQHSAGFTTIYAHNMKNLVEVGDHIGAGHVIATVGRSGRASAFHVHFEVRRGGMAYNPVYLLEPADAPVLASAPSATSDDDGSRE